MTPLEIVQLINENLLKYETKIKELEDENQKLKNAILDIVGELTMLDSVSDNIMTISKKVIHD